MRSTGGALCDGMSEGARLRCDVGGITTSGWAARLRRILPSTRGCHHDPRSAAPGLVPGWRTRDRIRQRRCVLQEARFVTACPRALDFDAMSAASRHLVGLHDFAAFCRQREGATTIRDLQRLGWSRGGERVTAYVSAEAFNRRRAL